MENIKTKIIDCLKPRGGEKREEERTGKPESWTLLKCLVILFFKVILRKSNARHGGTWFQPQHVRDEGS